MKEGFFFFFFGPKESRNAVTSKGEDANWTEVPVVSVVSLEYEEEPYIGDQKSSLSIPGSGINWLCDCHQSRTLSGPQFL